MVDWSRFRTAWRSFCSFFNLKEVENIRILDEFEVQIDKSFPWSQFGLVHVMNSMDTFLQFL